MREMSAILLLVLFAFTAFAQVDTLFFEDFEGDVAGWTMDDLNWESANYEGDSVTTYWHTSDFEAYEGNSWWCGDDEELGYDNGWLQALTTPAIELTGEPVLTFMHSYNIEEPAEYEGYDGWDALNVRISIDGGMTWEVIEPDGGYDATSCYGFGFNHEGEGVPGWGGVSGGFEEATFDLYDYAGETVHIRWVFGSDPAYCSINYGEGAGTYDPDMFGWVVDNIEIAAGGEVLFSDDGGDSAPSMMTQENLRRPQFWMVSDENSYSPSHSANFPNLLESQSMFVSPVIDIEEDYLAEISFYAYADIPDDANEEGNLEDFYSVYLIWEHAGEDTMQRLTYDYGREPWIDDWAIEDGSTIFNGVLDLRGFTGLPNSRLAFLAVNDGNHTNYADPGASFEGTGVWIDDILITGRRGLLHDVSISNITTGPINVGEPVLFSATIDNPGLTDETSVMALWRMYTAGYADTLDVGFFPRPSVESGGWADVTDTYEFDTPGDYIIRIWTNMPGDLDRTNDTLELEFTVPHEHQNVIGYDDGNPRDYGLSTMYLYADTLANTGAAITCESPYMPTYLDEVMFYGHDTTMVDVVLYSLDMDDRPDAEIERWEDVSVAADGWFTIDLDNYMLDDNIFGIGIMSAVEGEPIAIGADFSPPHAERSYIRLWDDEAELFWWLKLAAGEAAEPYDTCDMMIRVKVNDGVGIDEAPKTPMAFGLNDNYPNPFNPTTGISYQLDEEMDVRLEVFNVLGERVSTLVDERQGAGAYATRFDAGDLPSGVYFYKLTTPKEEFTKKMMLLK